MIALQTSVSALAHGPTPGAAKMQLINYDEASMEKILAYSIRVARNMWEPKPADDDPEFLPYLHNIVYRTRCTRAVVATGMLYLQRLKGRFPQTGSPGCSQRLQLMALMAASKILFDDALTNKSWAKVTGLELSEINAMEVEFLGAINYDLHVTESEYRGFVCYLEGSMAVDGLVQAVVEEKPLAVSPSTQRRAHGQSTSSSTSQSKPSSAGVRSSAKQAMSSPTKLQRQPSRIPVRVQPLQTSTHHNTTSNSSAPAYNYALTHVAKVHNAARYVAPVATTKAAPAWACVDGGATAIRTAGN